MVCAVRADHPLVKDDLDLNTYTSLQHLLISPQGSGVSMMDTVLQAQGLSRNIFMRVPHFLVAPMIIAKSDLICTMPKRIAEPFAEVGWLKLLPPPLPCPNFEINLLWHKRFDADPGQAWLRDLIVKVASSI
jgi:DNA-binding transcriptional LysR family regulator